MGRIVTGAVIERALGRGKEAAIPPGTRRDAHDSSHAAAEHHAGPETENPSAACDTGTHTGHTRACDALSDHARTDAATRIAEDSTGHAETGAAGSGGHREIGRRSGAR